MKADASDEALRGEGARTGGRGLGKSWGAADEGKVLVDGLAEAQAGSVQREAGLMPAARAAEMRAERKAATVGEDVGESGAWGTGRSSGRGRVGRRGA